MKNENYLERIAIALETLVSQGNYLSGEVVEAVTTPTIEATPEKKEVKPVVAEYVEQTHADLKDACLKSARSDSKNRDKLKGLLKEYNAVKAVDVPADKLAEVIARINKGDF